MLLAMSCIGLVDAIAKHLASGLEGVQVTWGYFATMLLFLAVWAPCAAFGSSRHAASLSRRAAAVAGIRALLETRHPGLQCLRAACLVASLTCLFTALAYLGLAEATVIGFTSPLFVVTLASPLLRERPSRASRVAVSLGFLGALVVIRPGTTLFQWAALLPLLGAVFFALFNLLTRKLGALDPPRATLFYTFCLGTVLLSAALPWFWVPMSPPEIGFALLSGLLGLVAHASMVRALSLGRASALAPINYIRIVWATGIGYVAFREVPDLATLLGGAIIVFSGLLVAWAAATAVPALAGGASILSRSHERVDRPGSQR